LRLRQIKILLMRENSTNTSHLSSREMRIFEVSPGHNLLIKADPPVFTIVAASASHLKLTGKRLHDVLGKGLFEAFPPNPDNPEDTSDKDLRASFMHVVATGESHQLPVQRYDVSNKENVFEERYWRIANCPVKGDDGSVEFILNSLQDITHDVNSKHWEERLKPLHQALNLYRQAPMPIQLFKGLDLIIELANDLTLKMWDRTSEVIGKPFLEAFPELKETGFIELMQEVIHTGVSKTFYETPIRLHRNGKNELGYFTFEYQPYYEEGYEEPTGLLVFSNEVTEQVINREKIKQSELSLELAIEIAELGIYAVDVQSGKANYSRKLMEWFNMPESHCLMAEIFAKVHPDDLQEVYKVIVRSMDSAAGGKHNLIFRVLHPVTKEITYLSSIGQMQYDGDRAVSVSGVMQNVTSQVLAQKEIEDEVALRTKELAEVNNALIQNNRELEQFAYIASHDLQEPLRKVTTFTQLLNLKLADSSDEVKLYISRVQSSIKRMSELIRDVLDFSQLNLNREGIEPVNLNQVIMDVIAESQPEIESSGAQINYDSLPVIQAVPLQMKQLFSNLISNSLKFSRKGMKPIVNIRSQRLKKNRLHGYKGLLPDVDYYSIAVEDNGIGFNNAHAERIFGIFQRLHSKQEFEGTGIGLAICRKIVQNHFGEIHASSSENDGAVFTVMLPEKQTNQ